MQAAAQLPSAPPSQAAQQPLNQLKNRRKVRQLQKTDTSTYAPALNLTGWGVAARLRFAAAVIAVVLRVLAG